MRRKTVLVSVPGKVGGAIFLPPNWGNLKGYCERSPLVREQFDWLDPVFTKEPPERLFERLEDELDGRPIDVLGLGCYCWNTDHNLAIAEAARQRHPDCLIVAGGPDPDYRQPDFFARHPYLDAVVLQDGEAPFLAILEGLAAEALDLASVPGLVLPRPPGGGPWVLRDEDDGGHLYTEAPGRFLDFDYSPWVGQSDYFDRAWRQLRGERGERELIVIWETDRGCPYKCTYCDWGSSTNSKIRRIGMDRLREEADWIGRNRIEGVFMAAANFGVLARDIEIMDALIEAKKKHGFPRYAWWSNAKNNVERVIDIHVRAFDAGLITYHALSIQTLDDRVLSAMDRSNIPKEKQLRMLEGLREKKIPSVVQLIYGGPNDSLEVFRDSLAGLMEWGVHDEFITYPFFVLPNAPANEPAYRAKWGIETLSRYGGANRRPKSDPLREADDRYDFIVATSTFDRHEYIDMYVLGRLLIALHNSGLTQHVSRYLRQTHGVGYAELYRRLVEHVSRRGAGEEGGLIASTYARCREHIARFVLDGEERVEQIEIEDLPSFSWLVSIEEYMMYRFLTDCDTFYAELGEFLTAELGHVDALPSLISYQRGLMITPDYDRRIGRELALEHDWPGYFDDRHLTATEVPEPEAFTRPVVLRIQRTHAGVHRDYPLDWHETADDGRPLLHRYLDAVIDIEYARLQRTYFKGVTFAEASLLAATG